MMSESPVGAKSARLQEVCHDIDRFLDSSAVSELGLKSDDRARAALSSMPPSKGQELLVIQRLSRRNEDLKQQLEDCQQEMKMRFQPPLSREAEQKRDQTDVDARAKKRRLSEMENEMAKLRQERDSLVFELREAREEADREREGRRKVAEQSTRHEDDLKSIISSLESELQNSKGSQLPPAKSEDAWKSRVSELEQEVFYLRALLKDWYPEHELASQLRSKHVQFEDQIRQSQQAVEDLLHAREKILTLEQEKFSLQAALEIQEASLKQCKEAASESTRAKQNLALYQATIADILLAAQQLPGELPRESTPANLRLAWSRLHSHWTKEAHRVLDLERKVNEGDQQSQMKAQMSKLHIDLSLANVQLKEVQGKLKESDDVVQKLNAQNSVLREALAGKQMQVPIQSTDDSLIAKATSTKALECLQEEQQGAIEAIKQEAEALKAELGRLADVERKLRKVESVNAELWQANKELERRTQVQNIEMDLAQAEATDYDARTTKILHLIRGPQDEAAGSGCDLEQQQAARQLERYKKATKKYVSEFREGLYHLLGWKVEMRGDGNSLRWHLTSRYGQVRQELVFQLRPGRSGQPAEFDLLGTPWAEQLQTDRQAMAYLEVYNSIPGFLAHITVDRLAQQTFTR